MAYYYIPYILGTLGDTGVHRHKTEPVFIRDRTIDLETASTCKHTNTHSYMLYSLLTGLHAAGPCRHNDSKVPNHCATALLCSNVRVLQVPESDIGGL